jgi:metal-responsive CopG/Arc/MetJ family transcriptional regulator
MNFNIYIDDNLGRKIDCLASKTGMKRNAIVREALSSWIEQQERSEWPQSVLKWQGTDVFIEFEATRDELKPISEESIF